MKTVSVDTSEHESTCEAGSHIHIPTESSNDSSLRTYVDWLNEQKFSERKELIKFLFTIASAILTFTIAFRKDIIGTGQPANINLLQASWLLLLSSIIFALIYYFLEYRMIFYIRARKLNISIPWTHHAGFLETAIYNMSVYLTPLSFIASLILLTYFVLINVH